MAIISPKEFEDKMKDLYTEGYDIECAHGDADELMCEVLESLGYTTGVKIFNDACKYYA